MARRNHKARDESQGASGDHLADMLGVERAPSVFDILDALNPPANSDAVTDAIDDLSHPHPDTSFVPHKSAEIAAPTNDPADELPSGAPQSSHDYPAEIRLHLGLIKGLGRPILGGLQLIQQRLGRRLESVGTINMHPPETLFLQCYGPKLAQRAIQAVCVAHNTLLLPPLELHEESAEQDTLDILGAMLADSAGKRLGRQGGIIISPKYGKVVLEKIQGLKHGTIGGETWYEIVLKSHVPGRDSRAISSTLGIPPEVQRISLGYIWSDATIQKASKRLLELPERQITARLGKCAYMTASQKHTAPVRPTLLSLDRVI